MRRLPCEVLSGVRGLLRRPVHVRKRRDVPRVCAGPRRRRLVEPAVLAVRGGRVRAEQLRQRPDRLRCLRLPILLGLLG